MLSQRITGGELFIKSPPPDPHPKTFIIFMIFKSVIAEDNGRRTFCKRSSPGPPLKNFYNFYDIWGVLSIPPSSRDALEVINEMAGKTLWKRVIPRTPFLNFL